MIIPKELGRRGWRVVLDEAKLKIYYDATGSVWKVRKIVDEHNHTIALAMFRHLLPSHRKMSDGDKAQVDSMKQFRIATSKIMAFMAGQSATTISYLEGEANADLMTVARYTRMADDQLGSLFWAKGAIMADYQLFDDVLDFDTTYWLNNYKKPLIVFSRSNHHRQTCILVVTYADKSMCATINEVLPSARHRLCGSHLEKNCVQRVKDAKFRRVFKKEIYANFYPYELEECEGITAFIKGFLKFTDSILELVHSLDQVVKHYRNNEVTTQFYSTYYTPVLTTELDSIDLFAWKLYT
ncbi:protein FAR1-RELATED SEQUENCE 5-like [Arachis ipaensis]|uniref:protein FAR1-RELATED SEQUENCE 5-like n=1 Tax=Arachis ipaensis TaxID=130454 RepID=UPI0007AFAC51|nr:protein FAR1-RELATED SEQUENCE 5-like [Arachis ipaensis]